MSSIWTEDNIELLREHWSKGESAAVIAILLQEKTGQAITRNMVIGKVHRLGLHRTTLGPRPPKEPGLERPKRERKPTPIPPETQEENPMPLPLPPGHPLALEPGPIPNGPLPEGAEPKTVEELLEEQDSLEPPILEDNRPPGSKTIFEVRMCECRWPLGAMMDKPEFFCAQPTAVNQSYCADHAKIAYVPAARIRIRAPRQ